MQTMNITLPDQLKEFVEDQVGSGRYSSASEYVRELIREDEKRKADVRVEELLLEGIPSGPPTEMTADDWRRLRLEAFERFEARSQAKKSS